MFKATPKISNVSASISLEITAKAKKMKADGIDVVSMGSGEPDFATPDYIKQAAITALNNNKTKYTAVDGILELKNAISNKFIKDNNLSYKENEIIVSNGGKQIVFNLAQVLLNKNDEVIIPAPYWLSYPEIITISEAKSVLVETSYENDFKITKEQLIKNINKNTKLVILNSPVNPTGSVYDKNDLLELAQVLLDYPDIYILSDDIYEDIIWSDEKFHNIVMVEKKLKERTIVLNGVSKSHCMTGFRIGYAAGNSDIISAMKKIQSHSTSNPCSISQYAAVAALEADKKHILFMVNEFKKRHDILLKSLNEIDGIKCFAAKGAFYLFPSVEGIIKKLNLKNDLDFCKFCLEKLKIAIVPGSAFGMPNYVRFSISVSMATVLKLVSRLKTI